MDPHRVLFESLSKKERRRLRYQMTVKRRKLADAAIVDDAELINTSSNEVLLPPPDYAEGFIKGDHAEDAAVSMYNQQGDGAMMVDAFDDDLQFLLGFDDTDDLQFQQEQNVTQENEAVGSNIPQQLILTDGFDFERYLLLLNGKELRQGEPSDAMDPFYPPGSTLSKKQAAEIISAFFESHNLDGLVRESFFQTFRALLPQANLPIKTTQRGNIVNKTFDYVMPPESLLWLSFDCCWCGGFVYAGEEASHLDRCPHRNCRAYRYTKCTRCNSEGACNHMYCRSATLMFHYRPIAGIIKHLLEQPGFHVALSSMSLDSQPDVIRDVCDGEEYKDLLNQMHRRWSDLVEGLAEDYADCIPIFLVAAIYFDGAKVTNQGGHKFVPLVISLLNLPPEFRGVMGGGMFTISISVFQDSKLLFILLILS